MTHETKPISTSSQPALLAKARTKLSHMRSHAKRNSVPIEPTWNNPKTGFNSFMYDVGLPPSLLSKCRMRLRKLGFVKGNMYWDNPHADGRDDGRLSSEERKFHAALDDLVQLHMIKLDQEMKEVYAKYNMPWEDKVRRQGSNVRPRALHPDEHPVTGSYGTGRVRGRKLLERAKNANNAGDTTTTTETDTTTYIPYVLADSLNPIAMPRIADLREAVLDESSGIYGELKIRDAFNKSDDELNALINTLTTHAEYIYDVTGGFSEGSPTNFDLIRGLAWGTEARDIRARRDKAEQEESVLAAQLREANAAIRDPETPLDEYHSVRKHREVLRVFYDKVRQELTDATKARDELVKDERVILKQLCKTRLTLESAAEKLQGLLASREAHRQAVAEREEREARAKPVTPHPEPQVKEEDDIFASLLPPQDMEEKKHTATDPESRAVLQAMLDEWDAEDA